MAGVRPISTQQNGLGGLVTSYILPTTDLGPERVKEFETGFDLGLWQDKADLGFTWYRAGLQRRHPEPADRRQHRLHPEAGQRRHACATPASRWR